MSTISYLVIEDLSQTGAEYVGSAMIGCFGESLVTVVWIGGPTTRPGVEKFGEYGFTTFLEALEEDNIVF